MKDEPVSLSRLEAVRLMAIVKQAPKDAYRFVIGQTNCHIGVHTKVLVVNRDGECLVNENITDYDEF